MTANDAQSAAPSRRSMAFREPGRERLRELLRWRRIPGGLRYLARHGPMALLRRLFPRLRTYGAWVRSFDTPSTDDIARIEAAIRAMPQRPLVSLLLPVRADDMPFVGRALDNLAAQPYPAWEACIAAAPAAAAAVAEMLRARPGGGRIKLAAPGRSDDRADLLNTALALAGGSHAAVIGAADRIAPHGLFVLADELVRHPDAAILYSDEDAIGPGGRRCQPRFKTDWNPDLLLAQDAVGRLAAYRCDLLRQVGGWRPGFLGAEEHDLTLRVGERVAAEQIRHIPMILYHRQDPDGAPHGDIAAAAEARRRVAAEHLARTGVDAAVRLLPGNRIRICHALPAALPGVSLIIPTRDKPQLLRRCIDGLLHDTDYEPLEIIIVDNDSVEPETLAYFAELAAEPRIRLLPYSGAFNYSAINNFAVARAGHDLIGLVNNDIEVIHADWLREMVAHALRAEIGAVGAKLYYPNDRVQHAGTIVGLGGAAGHAFRYFRRDAAGYCDRLVLTQNLSAVTAACLLMRRRVFDEVGGLDETNLPIAFNDVDLCLRIRERGYRIVWTPFAELYHWESVSRGNDLDRDKVERFRGEATYLAECWRHVVAHDPYYNPNLTVEDEDFTPAFPPRVVPPWRLRRDAH